MKLGQSVLGDRPEPKSFAPPALLSDPAFSADPYSNPYFASPEPAWLSSVPPGHPTLKDKSRRILTAAQPSSDEPEFNLIQPPNSPVPPSAGPSSYFTIPQSAPALPSSSTSSTSSTPSAQPPTPIFRPRPQSPPLTLPPDPPVKEEKKKKRGIMPFLTRRKSASQVDSVKSLSVPDVRKPPAQGSTSSVSVNDVTNQRRPSPPSTTAPTNGFAKPSSSHRSLSTGANTPSSRSIITSASRTTGISNDSSTNARPKNLDRIDELDETNPWGVSLHHGGPYEAAIRGLKQGSGSQSATSGSEQSQRGLHSHPNFYVPPQVPPGVSLKLSPGQILPRNFNLKDWERTPKRPSPKSAPSSTSGRSMPLYRPQMLDPPSPFPAMSSPPTRTTPSIASGQPMPSYRSQTVPALVPSSFSPPSPSYPPLLSPRSPLPNPHSQPVMNAQSSEILLEQDVEEPESHTPSNDATFDIGMAMLQPDGLQPQTPTIFLDPGASDEQEFDPYDPAHLELEHSRTPSPLPNPHVAPEPSRRSSPEPHDHQNSSVESAGQKETLDKRDDDKSASPQQHTREPPPYEFSVPEDVPERGQAAQAVAEPRNLSQRSSPRSNVNQDLLQENNSSRQENIMTQDHAGRTSSAHHNLNNFNLTPPVERATSSYSRPPPPPAQPIYRQNNEHPQNPPQNHPPPALPETDFANFRNPMHPPSQPASVYSRDRDVRSTHHSISTYSSSQSRNGPPPPHRRVPKHLVMPAPLNTNPMNQNLNGMVINRPQSNYIPAQIPSVPQIPSAKVQVHLRSQSHLPFPQPPTMLAHSQPMSTRPQPGSSNKLKKRVSMFGSSTPSAGKQLPTPQAVTTVSFAPPIVGFSQGPYSEKAMARSKTEKLAKGMLRKGGKGDF